MYLDFETHAIIDQGESAPSPPVSLRLTVVCLRMHPLLVRSNDCSKVRTQTIVAHPGGSSPSRVQLHIPGISSRNSNTDSDDHAYTNAHTDGDSDAHVNGYTDEYAYSDCDVNPDDHTHADDQPDGDLRFP